jgi:hypothetical protein
MSARIADDYRICSKDLLIFLDEKLEAVVFVKSRAQPQNPKNETETPPELFIE